MFMLWLIFRVLLVVNGFQEDEDEWIDPTDMLNYDAASGQMRRPHLMTSNAKTSKDFTEINQDQSSCPDCASCERQLQSLQKKLEESKTVQSAEDSGLSCNPVFKRFLNKLLLHTEKLGLPEHYDEVHYDAEIYMTKHDVTEIQKFLNGKLWKSGPLDDALSKLLVNFKYHDPKAWEWKFEDIFGVDLLTAFQLLGCLVCIILIVRLSWTMLTRPYRFLLFCLFISFAWNWVYLYKTAFAKRHANFAKLELNKPMCTGVQNMDWKGSLVEWFRRTWTLQDEPCEKYYEALLVHPIWEVPPARALMLTITTLITEPLKHIGQPLSQFFRDILKDLPWLLQFPLFLILALSIIAFCYSCGHTVVQGGLHRLLPDEGSRHPIADRSLPCAGQRPIHSTFYQRAGYVDYQAGGDAQYIHNNRKDINDEQSESGDTDPAGQNNMNQQGVEDVVNWERAVVSNERGNNQLRKRRILSSRFSGNTFEDQSVNGVFLSTEPQPFEENLQYAENDVTDHNVAQQARGIVGENEVGDLQSKDTTGIPQNNLKTRLYNEQRPGEKDVQITGRVFDPCTVDCFFDVNPQHPADGSATGTEPIDKQNFHKEKLENEESFLENVGAQEERWKQSLGQD
ncbi:chloride channel CLIC-like protein 1 isoform X2 [Narcine bancroftii]|uniref:chloride channel CLIC-like protein 1 isoform X2 n=1 Tax=Narcine bancroftii TaxID=1343680 RepID=UPI0038312FC4